MKSYIIKSSILASFLTLTTSVFAGSVGFINYNIPGSLQGATAVPTLSGTMLIILSLLLFTVAFRIAKQKNKGVSRFFITLLGVSALSTGAGGIKLVSDVEAGVTTTIPFAVESGQTTGVVQLSPGNNYFDNPHTVPVTITNITITNNNYTCGSRDVFAKQADFNSPTCRDIAPNNIVPAGEQCQVLCFFVELL